MQSTAALIAKDVMFCAILFHFCAERACVPMIASTRAALMPLAPSFERTAALSDALHVTGPPPKYSKHSLLSACAGAAAASSSLLLLSPLLFLLPARAVVLPLLLPARAVLQSLLLPARAVRRLRRI